MSRTFIHETCCIDDHVDLGEGCKLWHFTHVLPHTQLGNDCIVGQNCSLGPQVKIGNRVKIQNNVSVYKGVHLEDEVFVGPSAVFTNVINPRAFLEKKEEFRGTLVKRGATIGANATVICGVTIGRYAMIGAGAVITKDVPDFALMTGVPARQTGWVSIAGNKLNFGADGTAHDDFDSSSYYLKNNQVEAMPGENNAVY